MALYFEYPCPGCRTVSNLHDPECRYDGTSRAEVEKAYTDILSVLVIEPQTIDGLRDMIHGHWSAQHTAALETLKREQRVQETHDERLVLLTPDEHKEQAADPDQEPIRTIHRYGSVPGCHDNAVFALIAWYEMVGFSWEETRERVIEWLIDTGTWDRGGFEESTPEQVVEKKRHVFEQGYGWKQAGQEAKAVIDRRR